MGTAPALSTVAVAFGGEIADSWMSIQLQDLSEYSGAATKLSTRQYEQLSRTIRSAYGYITVTQLMHFFQLYKSGRYGHFFGSVDPLTIMESLGKFAEERAERITKYEAKKQLAEQAEENQTVLRNNRMINLACERYNISPSERLSLLVLGVDAETLLEIGWLFRMGYETDEYKGILAQWNWILRYTGKPH